MPCQIVPCVSCHKCRGAMTVRIMSEMSCCIPYNDIRTLPCVLYVLYSLIPSRSHHEVTYFPYRTVPHYLNNACCSYETHLTNITSPCADRCIYLPCDLSTREVFGFLAPTHVFFALRLHFVRTPILIGNLQYFRQVALSSSVFFFFFYLARFLQLLSARWGHLEAI